MATEGPGASSNMASPHPNPLSMYILRLRLCSCNVDVSSAGKSEGRNIAGGACTRAFGEAANLSDHRPIEVRCKEPKVEELCWF